MFGLSCGSWNRTNGLLVQSQASLPTATIPQCLANLQTGNSSQGSHVCNHRQSNGGLRDVVRMTGFEPAVSCTRSTRSTKLSHILMKEHPAGIEPAHPPYSQRYATATPWVLFGNQLSKINQHRTVPQPRCKGSWGIQVRTTIVVCLR